MPNQSSPIESNNAFNKGMIKDLDDSLVGEGLWTHARNAVNNSHLGEMGVLGNEQSNELCVTAPYDIVGVLDITPGEWLIFSTNEVDNEIGIFQEATCKYVKLVNARCLNFKKSNLITGAVKSNYDCTYSAYWADGLNPDRFMNLSNVPYKYVKKKDPSNPDCYIKEYSNELDCDKLLLHPHLETPCLKLAKGKGAGQLPNGTYQAAVAYSVNGLRVTDYFTPSNPQSLFSHENVSGSLELIIENLDEQFDEYELVIIGFIAQNLTARKIGNYSTTQKTVMLDNYSASLEVIPYRLIPMLNNIYEKSNKMFALNGYLLRSAVTTKPDFNYQPLANNIRAKWVSVEYPSDYYVKGGHLMSYMRDEQYAFFIRWVYKTGHKSASYHIPGRSPEPIDLNIISGTDPDVIDSTVEKQEWQVRNTATVTTINPSLVADEGGTVIAEGDMGYWESTEQYPADKPQIWGSLCGKKIRHHKFPDNYTDGSDATHLHNQGGTAIRLLGVRFENIEHPLDFNGNPITDIVGYEILRGTREGNRTIVAKGLINNLREYVVPGKNTKGLYQNYPFNDLRPDQYHRHWTTFDQFVSSGDDDDDVTSSALKGYRKDMFSFHSPETNFRNPYLSTYELKVHNVEYGTSTGQFKYVYQHPKFKILTNGALYLATIMSGLIIANALISQTSVTIGGTADVPMTTPLTAGVEPLNDYGTNAIGYAAQIASGVTFTATAFDMINENILQAILLFTKPRDYALQVDQVGEYDHSSDVTAGNKRRRIDISNYVDPTLMQFGTGHRINNMFRNRFVGIKVEKEVENPAVEDNSRQLYSQVSANIGEDFTTTVSSYYASLKVDFQNQYGQLGNISQVPITQCLYVTEPIKRKKFASPVLFGGDIYVNRYTEKNSMFFFNTNACGLPDETIINYRTGVNIPFPRYWADTNKYEGFFGGDDSHIISRPSDQRFLNRKGSNGIFTVKNGYFYLFNSGVREFFVESEINLAHRDWGERMSERHYDRYSFTSTDELFRSDIIATGNYYKYDYSLSWTKNIQQYGGGWGYMLPSMYDPYVSQTCFANREKRVLYSLQRQMEGVKDNWRVYLANNYKDFNSRVTAIKGINKTGAIILYEDAEPTQFVGVDQLQTDAGTKITIGDGGLFNQALQSIVNADDTMQYGSCLSGRSAVNTPHGMFYVSEETGKVMLYGGSQLEEISRNGMNYWFQKYLPNKLLKRYPNYRVLDNPIAGIGTQSVYDPQYELLYISKVDYIPLDDEVKYDPDFGFYKEYQTTIKERLPSTYECPAGYTYNATLKTCVKVEYTNVLSSAQTTAAVAGPTNAYHGLRAPKVYAVGYPTYGLGTVTATLTASFWGPNFVSGGLPGDGFSSYVKNISVSSPSATLGVSYGFSETVCINQTKTYYIAVAADDALKVSIDGNVVLDLTGAAGATNSMGSDLYNTLHIYPITLTAGNHLFYFEYSNMLGPDMFAYSLFDMTLAELQAATNSNNLDVHNPTGLRYVYSNGQKVSSLSKRGGYFTETTEACPDEFVLSIDQNCVCKCAKTSYAAKEEVPGNLVDKLVTRRLRISLQDPQYFTRCAWTISYDPKNKMWVSFHDWHPDLVIQPHEHFMTIQGPGVYKHNKRWDSYCNFYGVDYPFEIEFPTSTANTITTIRNGEYILENYIFSNDGMSAHEVLDHNFDQAVIYNNEQISGALNLNLKPKSDPLTMLTYPRINANSIDILFSKEENKYRFNQFWDITKDRGEFTSTRTPMWLTDCNGYIRKINTDYVNYNKAPLERKKFRHYTDRFVLIRKISGNVKMLMKLFTTKKLYSPR